MLRLLVNVCVFVCASSITFQFMWAKTAMHTRARARTHTRTRTHTHTHTQDLVIVHFDAHSDMYGYDVAGGDNTYSHASPFARILEENLAQKVIQIGIRTMTAHVI